MILGRCRALYTRSCKVGTSPPSLPSPPPPRSSYCCECYACAAVASSAAAAAAAVADCWLRSAEFEEKYVTAAAAVAGCCCCYFHYYFSTLSHGFLSGPFSLLLLFVFTRTWPHGKQLEHSRHVVVRFPHRTGLSWERASSELWNLL